MHDIRSAGSTTPLRLGAKKEFERLAGDAPGGAGRMDRQTFVDRADIPTLPQDDAKRQALFERFDKDGDGLSADEFEALYEEAITPARSSQQARSEAERVWFHDGGPRDEGFRRIERDARDVGDDGMRDEARKQLAANAELESAAIRKLSPDEQKQYAELTHATGRDSTARLSLQMLLIEGKLPGAKTTSTTAQCTQQNLLEALHGAATQALQPPLDRDALVSDLVQEIAVPSAINQGPRSTCMMTSVQIMLATENPAEYVRLVAGLASPEGSVTMANGEVLRREPGMEKPDDSGRSASTRLFSPALMEYGNGGDEYRDEEDKSQFALWKYSGQSVDQQNRPLEAIFGRDFNNQNVLDGPVGFFAQVLPNVTDNRQDVINAIAERANRGEMVPVGVHWGDRDAAGNTHGQHALLVTKVEGDRVHYTNPWGIQESMSLDEFSQRLTMANME